MGRKTIVVLILVLMPAGIAAVYFACRRPPRVQMERYAPANALAYVEVASLVDLVSGLTGTKAWRELGSALGMSSQLQQVGRVADFFGRTGLGPEDAVIAGRAQVAAVVTGLEAEGGAADEGPYIHFKPRLALMIETHSGREAASRLVRERVPILAQRLLGRADAEERSHYFGAELVSFPGDSPDRRLVVTSIGGLLLIANHDSAIRSCLDAIEGRAPNLSENEVLKQHQPVVDNGGAAAVAFVTAAGSEQMAQLGPVLFAGRFTTDPERLGAVAGLFGHLTRQTIHGLLYGAEFTSEGVTERYLTVVAPRIAAEMAELARPAPDADRSPPALPRDVQGVTILNVGSIGDLPERTLKRLAPRVDVVGALALRQFIGTLRRQLGLAPSDSVGPALGSELILVRFGVEEPIAMVFRVRDRALLTGPLDRYLKTGNSSVASDSYRGAEVLVSTNEDGRAGTFVGSYLILATRVQIMKLIDAIMDNAGADAHGLAAARARAPVASVFSYYPGAGGAGEMMLTLSGLTRATDGSRDLLEADAVRRALTSLPPSISFTEFRDYGVYTETRSAVGNFGLIGSAVAR